MLMNRTMKDIAVFGVGAIAVLYLINPTFGMFEFIPDNIPLIGNLDEVGATALLIGALRYYGVDLSHLFKRDSQDTVR
ncbi:MAG: DUF1232 domain-containing protein [Chloroflexi bacterium]|nr:DUF1232 domain-containing protein [Chloroflexota bacterium]